mmetsp:Transcript_73738/g.186999  ORF Transcript_73738/g.186999 Transcript_73738/m.186999 type:complete len:112 (-) Transcript_73738:50-385(-)
MPGTLYCNIRFAAISNTAVVLTFSNKDLSCVTINSVVFGERPFPRWLASHCFALRSIWFEGSSSSNSAGSESNVRANPTFICQPPESSEQGLSKSAGLKLRPVSTSLARSS